MARAKDKLDSSYFKRRIFLGSIYLPNILLSTVRGILLITIPVYVGKLGLPYSLIGVAVAAISLGSLLADIPSGFMLDKLGERKTTLLSFTITAFSLLALSVLTSFDGIVLFTLLLGVGTALWWLSRHYVITIRVPYLYRGRASALIGATERIGLFIGPIIGGLLIASFGYNVTFASGLSIMLIGLLIYIVSARDLTYTTTRMVELTIDKIHKSNQRIEPDLRRIALLGFWQTVIQIVRYGRHFLIPVYGALVLNMPEASLGLVMGLSGLLDVVVAYPSGIVMDKLGRGISVAVSFTVMGFGLTVLAFSSSTVVFTLSAAIIGIGNGLGAGTMLTLGADIGAEFERRTTPKFLGAWHFMGDLGNAVAPTSLGILAGVAGIHYSSLALAMVSLSIATAMPKLIKRGP